MSIPARRADIQDNFHGTLVADPYRWLEDPASAETLAFVAAQNETTQAFIAATGLRDGLVARLTELWDYPKYTAPRRRGERLFFGKNDGLQNNTTLKLERYRLSGLALRVC